MRPPLLEHLLKGLTEASACCVEVSLEVVILMLVCFACREEIGANVHSMETETLLLVLCESNLVVAAVEVRQASEVVLMLRTCGPWTLAPMPV